MEEPSKTDQNTPRIGVLAIQGDYDAHAVALREAGAEAVLVRKPDELAAIDGLIIPGGESTTFLKFLARDGFLTALQDFVRQKPTFGTCAGCILLAKEVRNPAQESLAVLDATVERMRMDGRMTARFWTLRHGWKAGRWRWSIFGRLGL